MLRPIRLTEALRVGADARVAIVGAGGKSSLLFLLAREFNIPVIMSTTTHLANEQALLADHHIVLNDDKDLQNFLESQVEGITLLTGKPEKENRLTGLPMDMLRLIERSPHFQKTPILIEADGSRRLPLKAPAAHEPPIPNWVDQVIVVAGLKGLGQPIDPDHVHRPNLFADLGKQALGESVTIESLAKVLIDPKGGKKNIPANAKKFVVLNQADDEILLSQAGRLADKLLPFFDGVVVARLQDSQNPVKTVFKNVAGIVLAAGKSSRMGGRSKVLLSWQNETFVHRVSREALDAGLNPVIVITGASSRTVRKAIKDLPVKVVFNPAWKEGQSTSLRCGVKQLINKNIGAAIFLLADQPQITRQVIQALKEEFFRTTVPIIAPMIDGRRANPVLFDRSTFENLMALTGDIGGRALFSQYPVHWLPWHDLLLLMDVDTPQDFQALKAAFEERYDPQAR